MESHPVLRRASLACNCYEKGFIQQIPNRWLHRQQDGRLVPSYLR